jgi:hypothetical protein
MISMRFWGAARPPGLRTAVTATVAASACAALALVASGCGAANAIDPVATAATASTSTPGYRMSMSMQLSSPALAAPVAMTGTGSVDARRRAGTLSLDLNFGNNPAVAKALGGSTLHLDELIDGLVVYMKLPPALLGKTAYAGKPWLKLDLSKAAAAAGLSGLSSLFNNPSYGDPSQLLEYLRAVSGKVSNLGGETVNGVPTTRYRVRVNLDRVPDVVPAASRAGARKAIATLESLTHLHALPVDVWIDGRHLVRRERMSYTENLGGQNLDAQLSIDLSDYGPQPAIAYPSPDQVADLSGLIGG